MKVSIRPQPSLRKLRGSAPSRLISQPLSPSKAGRFSRSQGGWWQDWKWLHPEGDVPKGGLIAVFSEYRVGETWWFLHTDGLYRSADGGKKMTASLSAAVEPGSNFVVLAASDDKDIVTSRAFYVYRAESGEELALVAGEAGKVSN